MEMLPDSAGNSRLAIIRHDGQQEVAMNRCSSGTFSIKSRASSIVQISAPTATSTTSAKPSCFMAVRNFGTVTSLPNWPTNDGATMATTSLPSSMERMT